MATVSEQSVMITAVALMKIVKHAQENNPPLRVRGDLYGMLDESQNCLEVTHAWPRPPIDETPNAQVDTTEEDAKEATNREAVSIMLKKANIDSAMVGMYLITWHEYIPPKVLEDLAKLQDTDPSAVLILFDPFASLQRGKLALRAIRLSAKLVGSPLQRARSATTLNPAADLTSSEIFDTVPITLAPGSHMVAVFLAQLAKDMAVTTAPTPSLADQSLQSTLTRQLETLRESEETLAHTLSAYHFHLRKHIASQAAAGGARRVTAAAPPRLPVLQEAAILNPVAQQTMATAATALRDVYGLVQVLQGGGQPAATTGTATISSAPPPAM